MNANSTSQLFEKPMPSQVVPFKFEQHTVRTISRPNGEPWFVAADVCDALAISNNRDAVARLDDDEKADVGITDTSSNGATQGRNITAINESGLYSLIMTSRKPEAKKFKKWVTSEVLPSIRKTGSYSIGQAAPAFQVPTTLSGALMLAAQQAEQIEQQQAQLAISAPKAQALDRIALADGDMCITDAAKALGMQPKKLFAWMYEHLWIYKRAGGRKWIAHQDKLRVRYLESAVTTFEREDGTTKTVEAVIVTPKGLAKLAEVVA